MENLEETTETHEQTTLVVSEEIRSYIYEIAKWAGFLAIVGFVFTGIMIIGAFTIGAAMNTSPEIMLMAGPLGKFGSIFFTVICLVYAFAVFYPSLLLFKYSTKAKHGVLYGEQGSLNDALSKLKSLFKYWGILTIIFISLYVLAIISSIMAKV
ncbi:hypothetical protein GM921_07985 [Pedobacter sp. LMG 31464]|uniref:Uncharacterized protein n=1 Tax=Pedobacter planticolens TaxID=2679964 RepID=A0A923E0P6_9SPHI|nr:DUF5362 family protein [Pedobacter planticolens]MBB2145419.1 hypothetical protein [Pedobacter planticolens]